MSFNFSDKLSTSSSPSSASSLTQSSMTNRVNPQPKYLRDPTTMETISSTFNGISSFMMKNTLLGKAFQKNSNSSSNTPNSSSLSTSPMQKNEKTILSKIKPKATVTCTEFDTIYLNGEERRSCLLIGYSDGFHIWDIEDVGKISEIALIKLDIGEIKCLKLINSEDYDPQKTNLLIGAVRTLPASPDDDDDMNFVPKEISILCLYSLYENKIVHKNVYENEKITSFKTNEHCIALGTSLPSIRLLSRKDLLEYYCFTDILITPSSRVPVFALGARWIAYSTTLETPWKPDFKEVSSIPGKNSKVDRVAKDVVNGLKYIGDYGYQRLNNYLKQSPEQLNEPSSNPRRLSIGSGIRLQFEYTSNMSISPEEKGFLKDSGRVVIRDVLDFIDESVDHPLSPKMESMGSYLPSVAHFHCHYYPVACLAFNGSGNLLATASVEGHTFYIYEIIGANNQQPPFKLLYKLSRGLTDAKVIDMVFNIDSRWLATTTQHGTTHLFQINPYGGPPHHESHTSGRVMNPINPSTSNKGYTDYSKPYTLNPAARFKRTKDHDSMDNIDESSKEVSHSSIISNETLINSTKFLILTSSLCNWLKKLPSAYEISDSFENYLKSSQIMLNIDHEGSLMLVRINVTAKPILGSLPEDKEEELSIKIERIAEWGLSKNIGDNEKYFEIITNEVKVDSETNYLSELESRWLPYLETKNYNPYTSFNRPLWLLNQFDFKTYSNEPVMDNDSDEPGIIMFNKEKNEDEILRLTKQKILRPNSKVKVTYQPSSSKDEIKDHLVSAMQTDLEKPPITSSLPIRSDPISFEDALEIHMVETFGGNKKEVNQNRMNEIAPNFINEIIQNQSMNNSFNENQHKIEEEFAIFEMDNDDYSTNNELNNDMEAVPISNSNLDSDEFNLSNSPPLLSVRSRMTELDDCDDVQYEATDPSTSFTLDEFLNL